MPATDEEDLVEVGRVVRRVLAARTDDEHLVEDLTQETLVRVAAIEQRMTPTSVQAYAIGTARNLLVSHAHGQAVHGRHAHRLVDYTSLDGPEHLTLQREETDALAVALQRLDPAERDLLMRHEAEEVDIATLATETGSSTGAVAMRLARARAVLRLEFLLAFRHVELPSPQCRPVLIALSERDRRRQRTLDAAAHLGRCDTCAALARPMTERDRRIAGWLPVPIGGALGSLWRKVRSNPIAAVTVVALVLAVIGTAAVAGRDAPPRQSAEERSTAAAPPPATAALVATTAAVASPPVAVTPTAAPPACPAPAPLDQVDPATSPGCPFAPTAVTVTDVPADEGFAAVTAAGQVVWVELVGTGESPVDVEVGVQLTINGRTAPPNEAATAFTVEVAFPDLQLID